LNETKDEGLCLISEKVEWSKCKHGVKEKAFKHEAIMTCYLDL